MRKMKWIFFGYLAFVGLVIVGIALAFNAAPPRDAGTLYYTYYATVKTLDPAGVDDQQGSDLLAYVCEGLYNYRYNVRPFEIFPELAAKMPEVSANGLTMTIQLRHGIHFYDPDHAIWPDGNGPEVTADDYIYSFKRVCDFHLSSSNYSFVFQGHFPGLDQWWDYTQHTPEEKIDFDRPVEGFSAPDRYTLKLQFTHPYPQMIYNMVNCATSPVCRAIVTHWGKAFRQHLVGTGAYSVALSDNLRDQRIVFKPNPYYRGRPDVDGNAVVADSDRFPKIKTIQLSFFQEQIPAWQLFVQGLFDINTIPKDAYSQAIAGNTGDLTPELAGKGVVLQKVDFPSTDYIGINMSDPVLGKNKPLRQAMSLAFDRIRFINTFLNGRGSPAIGIIPPGFPTYDVNRVNPLTRFDLDRARQLMVEAEKINGGPIPPITLLLRGTDTSERQTGEFDAAMMSKIGITLVPVYHDWVRWQELVDNHQTQLFDGGWNADYPDEQDFLQLLYGKNTDIGGLNAAIYKNPEFDALYDRAAVLNDCPQRRELYLQAQKIVEDDCPWILIYYLKQYRLQYDWVGNRFSMMGYGHGYDQFFTLDQSLRAQRLSKK